MWIGVVDGLRRVGGPKPRGRVALIKNYAKE